MINVSSVSLYGLLHHFQHINLTIEYHNATSGKVLHESMVFDQVKIAIDGQPGILINITVSSEGGEGQHIMSLWTAKNYTHVFKIRIENQEITGTMAEVYGKQIINSLNNMLLAGSAESLQIEIAKGTASATMHGWIVNEVIPTKVTLSGHTYQGYYYKATNVNDNSSDAAWFEGKVVNLYGDMYYHVYGKARLKNNDLIIFTVVELKTWG